MRKPSMRAKWRSSISAYRSVLKNVLDTADIVRDGDVSTARRMLFPETLDPIAADRRDIVGQQQPTSVEPVACGWTKVASHPCSRILTPAPPNVADYPLIAFLKLSLLVLKDSVDAPLRECWLAFPRCQDGQRQLNHGLGLLLYEVVGRLRIRNVITLQVGSESFAPQNQSLPAYSFRNERQALRGGRVPSLHRSFKRLLVVHCDKEFVYIFGKRMQLCLAAHHLDFTG